MAVKIKLKRLGKIRAPYYRIVVADARTKRDGRAIEEIGKYHPKAEPSLIEVDSARAQHWLSVGAQPTDPVRKIFEVTGDWQKFKGLPGTEGTLRTAAPKENRKEIFAAAVQETLGDAAAGPKGRAKGKSGDAAKAEPAAKQAATAMAEKPAKPAKQPKAAGQPAKAEPKGDTGGGAKATKAKAGADAGAGAAAKPADKGKADPGAGTAKAADKAAADKAAKAETAAAKAPDSPAADAESAAKGGPEAEPAESAESAGRPDSGG